MTILLIWLVSLTSSCGGGDPLPTGDPRNLQVEVTYPDVPDGTVQVRATAENAVEYRFYADSGTDPLEANTSGLYVYRFATFGVHSIEVRAYGESGRYLKDQRDLDLGTEPEVGLDKGYTSPLEYEGFDLVWQDEFEGSELNSRFWVYETGNGCPANCGWGNNELQFYRQNNARVGDGVLTIEARKETYQNSQYTSARIKTQDLKTFKYGRVDIRALLPKGQGIWPALWMLGSNIRSVGWPECGEIDIMEMIGGSGRENTVHGTLHWGGPAGEHQQAGGSKSLSRGTFADEYHVFSVIWDESAIRWYLNNQQYHIISITPEILSEFHQPFFFIFNVAVGGAWPGNPNATTVFPQRMKVDYVRVFQKK